MTVKNILFKIFMTSLYYTYICTYIYYLFVTETLFVIFPFIKIFRYKKQFSFALKNTTGKIKNYSLKVPSRTNYLSIKLFTSKLPLD